MSNIDHLRGHYDSLETSTLLELWSRGGQMEWAEQLLRAELMRRGVSDDVLAELEANRDKLNAEIAQQQDRIQVRVMGPWIAMMLAASLGSLMGGLFGPRAAMITVAVILAGYGTMLLRMMRHFPADLRTVGTGVFTAGKTILQIVVAYGVAVLLIYFAIVGKF